MRSSVRLAGVVVLTLAVIVAVMAVTTKRGAAHTTNTAAPATTARHSTAAATPTPAPSATSSPTATPAPTPTPGITVSQTTQSIDVNGATRQYLVVSPSSTTAESLPIVVVLGGIQASVQLELSRDGLVPLVQAGAAELIYPVGYNESWNAGGCCGDAAYTGVDDPTFITALVATVDPGHNVPIYLVGYSNGGRLAYTLACGNPSLFDAYAIVKAVPLTPCAAQAPINILQIAATDDWEVPYQPGDSGDVWPPVTEQVGLLQQSNGCDPPSTTTVTGSLTYQTWVSCAQGTRLAFATYADGSQHLWPAGDAATPNAADVIERFFGMS
ncbi:MAG: hypothetical protein JOZ75_07945 [Candidatus Dormibacteraeota bacterium]|nr:hypothetical protein [Candidatus Dormibacteraeota bacterium]